MLPVRDLQDQTVSKTLNIYKCLMTITFMEQDQVIKELDTEYRKILQMNREQYNRFIIGGFAS